MKIAAYCRVSTDKDEQLDSLEHQKEFFTEFAVQNGHTLVQLYADEGISGTSLKKREEFQRLMQDAKDSGRVIDVSCGRRTRSVIITDSEHIILSAIQSETIANRLVNEDDDEEELE